MPGSLIQCVLPDLVPKAFAGLRSSKVSSVSMSNLCGNGKSVVARKIGFSADPKRHNPGLLLSNCNEIKFFHKVNPIRPS